MTTEWIGTVDMLRGSASKYATSPACFQIFLPTKDSFGVHEADPVHLQATGWDASLSKAGDGMHVSMQMLCFAKTAYMNQSLFSMT